MKTLFIGAIISLLSFASSAAYAQANEAGKTTRIVEPVPSLDNLYHKTATKTPSGFAVPRFVSLKFGRVNGRTGPSRDHSIAWQYQRRGMPLVVVAETEMWRKVRDITGDEAWVYKPALTGERHVLTLSETDIRVKPKLNAAIAAVTDRDALLKLEKCEADGWCRVRAENGLKGWALRQNLWGAQRLK